ncbi:MAG: helix-hairpin-helix domain-containing protein [Lapillicoccus sp.]
MSLRGARVGVSWLAVGALVLLLVVAALLFAVRVARAESGSRPQPIVGSTPAGIVRSSVPAGFATAGSAATGGPTVASLPHGPTSGAGGGLGSSAVVVVDVVGQVGHPGVVTLAQGGRVVTALALAGGALPGADLQRLNLARVLVDGEQIFVPRPGEDPPKAVNGPGTPISGGGSPGVGSTGGSTDIPVLDLNGADLNALDSLPGVGPVLAQRILDWRVQHGRFSSVDELGEVSGIGDKVLELLRPHVRV